MHSAVNRITVHTFLALLSSRTNALWLGKGAVRGAPCSRRRRAVLAAQPTAPRPTRQRRWHARCAAKRCTKAFGVEWAPKCLAAVGVHTNWRILSTAAKRTARRCIGGVACGPKKRIRPVKDWCAVFGQFVPANIATLFTTEIATMPARVRAAGAAALTVARALESPDFPLVDRVCYPGLPSHPTHDRAKECVLPCPTPPRPVPPCNEHGLLAFLQWFHFAHSPTALRAHPACGCMCRGCFRMLPCSCQAPPFPPAKTKWQGRFTHACV